MVANYRCNEIRGEAVDKVKDKLSQLQKEAMRGLQDDFGQKCEDILKEATKYYEFEACQYKKDVFEKVLKELSDYLVQELF
jgi:hypothetical protein